MKKFLFLLCVLLCSYAAAAENPAHVAPVAPVAAESPAPVPGWREVDAAFVARLTAMHASGDAQQAAALAGLLDSLSPLALTQALVLASGSEKPEEKAFAEYALAGLSPERTAQVVLACDNLEDYAFQQRVLHMPDKARLARVRDAIREDLRRCDEFKGDAYNACTDSRKIVGGDAMSVRLAWWAVHYIDDQLGTLEYDRVLDGRFVRITGGAVVLFYDFKTRSGKIVPVGDDPSTLWLGFDESRDYNEKMYMYRGQIRLFVREITMYKKPWYYIVKAVPLRSGGASGKAARSGGQ